MTRASTALEDSTGGNRRDAIKLKRLKITNCSWIEDLDIEVRQNLVLIGPNGGGKTAMLLCLEMLLETDDRHLCESITEDYILIVAHSPTIAGSFEPDEIVVIRADGSAT